MKQMNLILVFGLSLLSLNTWAKTYEAQWTSDKVIIDGCHDEWKFGLHYFEKQNLSLGVQRDSSHLYLCLVTNDRELKRQIMGMGLKVWVNGQRIRTRIEFP